MLKRSATIVGLIVASLTLISLLGSGVVWAVDQIKANGDKRWVTHNVLANQLKVSFANYHLSSINDTIGELEMKIKYGEGTKADELTLEYYKRRRGELIATLNR